MPTIGNLGTLYVRNKQGELEEVPVICGKDGEPGTPPHIGENGNWWIGEEDSGVLAEIPGYIISNIMRTNSISTTGETVYYLQVNRRNGTFYSIELPQTPNAVRLEIGEPTSSDKGAGANNSPFWYDKQSGYLWHYAGQNAMNNTTAKWKQVRGRPQVTSGEGAPTTSTVGEKDDLYVDSTTKYLYWCSGYTNSTTYPGQYDYNWVRLTTTITISGGSGGIIDTPEAGDPGITALKAVYDEDTGELTVSGGTVAFDEETGELTVSGSPLSLDEETGEMSIGG